MVGSKNAARAATDKAAFGSCTWIPLSVITAAPAETKTEKNVVNLNTLKKENRRSEIKEPKESSLSPPNSRRPCFRIHFSKHK